MYLTKKLRKRKTVSQYINAGMLWKYHNQGSSRQHTAQASEQTEGLLANNKTHWQAWMYLRHVRVTEASLFKGVCLLHPASQFIIRNVHHQEYSSDSAKLILAQTRACLSIPTGAAPHPGDPVGWPASMYSYDTAVYWIILLDEGHCLGSGTKAVIS